MNLDEGDKISDIGYSAVGCAISKAAASMMSEAVKGKSSGQAMEVVSEFRKMITDTDGAEFDYEIMGDLEILEGVTNYPTRIKCATLPLHTLGVGAGRRSEDGYDRVETSVSGEEWRPCRYR